MCLAERRLGAALRGRPRDAIPGVLAEALIYSRPGVLEVLPALPDQLPKGTITGVSARGRIHIHSFDWDLNARTATLSVTAASTRTSP
ncbi:hypothetical protein OG254_05335 [Streptomyces sp. NBC_01092]|nr:hypothetical protein OG254_05335 [Streptomyces sp. NBC_01092]